MGNNSNFYDILHTKSVIVPAGDKKETLKFLQDQKGLTVYGMLLNDDPKHPVSQVLKDRWDDLHSVTGDKFILIAFQPPEKLSQSYINDWKRRLGDSFEQTLAEWQSHAATSSVYGYLDTVREPKLKPSQLPCLVLFTSIDQTSAVIRAIPKWDADSLYPFLRNMLWTVKECSEKDLAPAERLDELQRTLSYPGADMVAELGHMTDQAIDYIKKHPAECAVASISFVLALTAGNVLALSAGTVIVLKALLKALGGKEEKETKIAALKPSV